MNTDINLVLNFTERTAVNMVRTSKETNMNMTCADDDDLTGV